MSELANSIARYAVIEVRRAEGPSERLVCAYPDEHSLRDVIASPSIIAFGFASREDAQASIERGLKATSCKENRRRHAIGGTDRYRTRNRCAAVRFRAKFDLEQTTRLVRGFAQSAVAAAVLTFYSKNALLTVVRSFLGGSF
jgi:hypothetical protein